jgi:hypothetical protein
VVLSAAEADKHSPRNYAAALEAQAAREIAEAADADEIKKEVVEKE